MFGLCVCMRASAHVYAQICALKPEEGIRSVEVGVTAVVETPACSIGAGRSAVVLVIA